MLKSKTIVADLRSKRLVDMSSAKGTYGLKVTIGLQIRAGGFTLIELLIVIAILGTISGIAAPLFASYVNQAKVERAKVEIRSIEREILAFYLENNRYPEDLAEIGLESFKDPYGNPYQYLPSPNDDEKGSKGQKYSEGKEKMRKDHNLVPVNTDFDLYSMGKDGESRAPFTAKASIDDIVRANNGQFLGLVSDY